MDGWQDTRLELPPGRWTNAFTGEVAEGGSTEVGVLLRSFPVALLHSEPAA
jgi:maltooligosyltrehalose synthase